MTPRVLVKALAERASPDLRGVRINSIHTEGQYEVASPGAEQSFRCNSLFTGSNLRRAIAEGRADFTPCFLSEIPTFFRRSIIPLDVALIQVSPPDSHGFCSLGTSVDVSVAACEMAPTIIAQVNPRVPRTHGDGHVHCSRFSKTIWVDSPVAIDLQQELSAIHKKIGENVASLVEDGSTLQAGIGLVPDATLKALVHHKDLGVHTEMFSDGLLDLIEAGVITNRLKKNFPDKVVTSFSVGSQRLMDYVHDNPGVVFLDVGYTNDPAVIKQNPKVVAINSAIEIDVTGQVVADSIGTRIYSGVGGQIDFMRGSAISEGGKPIIAFTSRTNRGESRIVPYIKEGAGVVTTRAHVHWVVTEYGIAELHGKCIRERAHALRDIAHPDDRASLDEAIHMRFNES